VTRRFSVYVIGAGKVGTALSRALRAKGVRVTLRAARKGAPRGPVDADLLVLAVRDGQLEALVRDLSARRSVEKRTAVVHCAGALGPEPLAPLRALSLGVAQMHPMISFASTKLTPSLARGQMNVDGDARAVRVATRVARLLGMSPRRLPGLDKVVYHASAGLVANGAAALAAAGTELLERAGIDPKLAARMLGPLLRSVADNVERLGLPESLTGPVRRGDERAVRRHLEVIRTHCPSIVPLYRELVLAQLPLARRLKDADAGAFERIAAVFSD
jgi:predicted short-subunit dehydrogenase-like oxidoreductase (DUF2520 family)